MVKKKETYVEVALDNAIELSLTTLNPSKPAWNERNLTSSSLETRDNFRILDNSEPSIVDRTYGQE